MPPLDSFSRGCHPNESVPHANCVGEVCEHDDTSPLASLNLWDQVIENKVHSHGDDEDSEEDCMPPLADLSRGHHNNENMSAYNGDEESEQDDMPPLASLNRWHHPTEKTLHSQDDEDSEEDDMPP